MNNALWGMVLNVSRLSLLIFCSLVCFSITPAQVSQRYIQIFDSELKRFGLGEDKLKELIKQGLDLRSMLVEQKKPNEMYLAAFADVIVVGRVGRLLAWPQTVDAPFHSKLEITIEEVLLGRFSVGDTIFALRRSGLILNDTIELFASTDFQYRPGERGLFFLQAADHNSYIRTAYAKKLDWIRQMTREGDFWVDSEGMIPIENGKVTLFGVTKELQEVRSGVLKVVSVVQSLR
jgi:hypothetical protein